MQTQCLVVGEAPGVQAKVRFLHVVERRVGRQNAAGSVEFVDQLQVGQRQYLAWEEAAEREVVAPPLPLTGLHSPQRLAIHIPAGSDEEVLRHGGEVAGVLVRSWQALQGAVEVEAESLQAGLWKLTVHITNTTPWHGQDRDSTLRQTLVSAHTLLTATQGEFVSLMDPPEALRPLTQACHNLHTWPVLVGRRSAGVTLGADHPL
jgi:hypothetical protein